MKIRFWNLFNDNNKASYLHKYRVCNLILSRHISRQNFLLHLEIFWKPLRSLLSYSKSMNNNKTNTKYLFQVTIHGIISNGCIDNKFKQFSYCHDCYTMLFKEVLQAIKSYLITLFFHIIPTSIKEVDKKSIIYS